MLVSDWIKCAQKRGWLVDHVGPSHIEVRCDKIGCTGHVRRFLDDLGPVPEACTKEHKGKMSAQALLPYAELVEELRRRRVQLGLDQTDLNNATGFADGYISKLEAMHRFPSVNYLAIWMQALGVRAVIEPDQLPPATIRIIQERRASPYQPQQARFRLSND